MIKRALRFLDSMWSRLILAALLMLTGTAASLGQPLILGRVFDRAENWRLWVGLLLVMICTAIICTNWKNYTLSSLSNRLAVRIRMELMVKIFSLPNSYFHRHTTGELLSAIGNDVNRFRDALSAGSIYILETVLSVIAGITVMVSLEPVLTLILFCSTGLILLCNTLLTRRAGNFAGQAQERLAKINNLAAQGIGGVQTVRAFHLTDFGMEMFHGANREWEKFEGRIIGIKTRVNISVGIFSGIQLVMMIGLGMLFVEKGRLTIGALMSFIIYAQSLVGPLSSAASLVVDVKAALASVARVVSILDEPVDHAGTLRPGHPSAGRITIEDVSFSYPREDGSRTPVLSGINLEIPSGKMTAMVGESGSGKTTLMSLLSGFLTPDRGRILLDGIPVQELDPEYLHENISMISQQPYLFQMSVAANIAAGKPDATMEEIQNAAKMAEAHDFILALPRGYDTVLDENAGNLSGGQRQRIAIARAFLKNAPILLMDEATSALDNRTERQIRQAVERLSAHKTVFVIAHRLSTIRRAGTICYLSGGVIRGRGTHEALLETCPGYKALCEGQHSSELSL